MITFGVIISNRSFFPAHLVLETRKKLFAALSLWGYHTIALSIDDTPMGQTMSRSEADKCAALFRAHADELDGIIVCLPNFGEETAVTDALSKCQLHLPILIQACDDDLDKLQLNNRRDAFCGKLSLCANLHQSSIPYTLTTRHTCAVDSEEFHRDVDRFAKVCNVLKALRNVRIAQIGVRVAPFRTVRYSEKLLQALGISIEVFDISAFISLVRSITDSKAIARKVEALRSYVHVDSCVSAEAMSAQACFSIALEKVLDELGCSACALECWDSLEREYGCAPCLAMSMLSENGLPCACEADVMGALSMLVLQNATGSAPILQDWDNNYGLVPDLCVNVHCSNYPSSTFSSKPNLGSLDILGTQLGESRSFGALKGRIRSGEMTYLRLSTDDRQGKVKGYFGEGLFTDDPLDSFGGVSVCKVPRLNDLMCYLAKNGYEHHIALAHGQAADVLEESLTNYLGITLYHHQ